MAAFVGFVDQVKLARRESAGVSALHALPYSSNPGDAMGTQGIKV